MKIRPVILCGGAGTRLWPDKKKHQAKQFIDFGGWSLIQKTLERINKPIFDFPIISTNLKYLKQVKLALKKSKIKKFKIVLEPAKKNTAPAILASALIKDIPLEQPLMFFAADHLIERSNILNKSLLKKSKITFQNKYNIIGDFDFFIRLSKIYKFKYVAKPVATYRIHKNNLSSKKKDLQIKEFQIWLKNNKKILEFEDYNILNIRLKKLQFIYKKFSSNFFTSFIFFLSSIDKLFSFKNLLILFMPKNVLKKIMWFV